MSPRLERTMRRALQSDARAIAALHIASWRATYTAELTPAFLDALDLDERVALWRERLARPDLHVLVVDEGETIVGFCASGFAETPEGGAAPWEILNLHIDPRHQGAGLGKRLFDAAVDLARDHGARKLILWVVDTNDRARAFYERRGMRPDGGRQTHPVGDGGSLVEVRYRMEL